MNDLAAIPPIPQEEVKPKPAPTLRRNPIRDSIRVAKGKRLGRFGKSAANSTTMLDEGEEDIGAMTTIEDAASPPSVPRFAHNRKRSVTQPQRPDTGRLRSYSPIALGGQGSPTGFAPADIFSIPDSRSPAQINEASGPIPMPSTREFRTASPNFFDALGNGMVRMEAFVDDRPDSSRTRASRNRSRRNKLDMIVWTAATDSEYPENGESEPESPSRVLRTGDSL
ncbi:hypothetical protein KEM55_002629 [Ascosphaera atra]|nr:hypothetical protein KEM55_002629 [Ascosphaera atra]